MDGVWLFGQTKIVRVFGIYDKRLRFLSDFQPFQKKKVMVQFIVFPIVGSFEWKNPAPNPCFLLKKVTFTSYHGDNTMTYYDKFLQFLGFGTSQYCGKGINFHSQNEICRYHLFLPAICDVCRYFYTNDI